MNEQNNELKQTTENCGPGCSCGTTGVGSRAKWVICGVVALVAVVVVAVRISTRTADNKTSQNSYATVVPSIASTDTAKQAIAVDSGAWGSPLKALAELNQVATNTDAVFVVVPSSDAERTAAIQKEVSAAASTITTRGGIKMGTFLMSQDSQEYAGLVKQIGSPAVLVMCKGAGMTALLDKEVNQDNLLKAFVGASRPSGCGPNQPGCGPGQSSCN